MAFVCSYIEWSLSLSHSRFFTIHLRSLSYNRRWMSIYIQCLSFFPIILSFCLLLPLLRVYTHTQCNLTPHTSVDVYVCLCATNGRRERLENWWWLIVGTNWSMVIVRERKNSRERTRRENEKKKFPKTSSCWKKNRKKEMKAADVHPGLKKNLKQGLVDLFVVAVVAKRKVHAKDKRTGEKKKGFWMDESVTHAYRNILLVEKI